MTVHRPTIDEAPYYAITITLYIHLWINDFLYDVWFFSDTSTIPIEYQRITTLKMFTKLKFLLDWNV